jgi:hypothetical protein
MDDQEGKILDYFLSPYRLTNDPSMPCLAKDLLVKARQAGHGILNLYTSLLLPAAPKEESCCRMGERRIGTQLMIDGQQVISQEASNL